MTALRLAVLALFAVLAVACTKGALTHREFYDKVQSAYGAAADHSGQQALATPAQLTALVHSTMATVTSARVAPDEFSDRRAIISAARDEITALCRLPATKDDQLSSIKDLNQYCAAPRPASLSTDKIQAVIEAENQLAAAINALPVR